MSEHIGCPVCGLYGAQHTAKDLEDHLDICAFKFEQVRWYRVVVEKLTVVFNMARDSRKRGHCTQELWDSLNDAEEVMTAGPEGKMP